MKILILADDFPPQSFGGAGISTFDLACGLQKAGHQVFVITTCQEKSDEAKLNKQGLKIFRIFANYHERWRAYLSLYNPQTIRKVRKIIKEVNPDIVHAHNIHSYLSYYCLKIAKEARKAVFLTARDVMSFNYEKLTTKKYLEHGDCYTSWWDHLKQAKKRYNPFRNIIIRHYLKYVDKIFAISHALKRALNENKIENVEVVYNAIDPNNWLVPSKKIEEFKKKYHLQGKKVIFFGGRISGPKGLEQISQAVVKVKKEIPATVLLIAGKGAIGWLSGDELKAAYHSADVVVMPSICFEAFGRAAIEGKVCKKPEVATCYGGVPEVVQDGVTGFIVNPFNIELMAEKIIDLLKNPKKARQFGRAGFERVKEHFSLDFNIKQTLSWYQKFLK